MIKKIKFSWDIVKAYSLDSNGKYSDALKMLNKYDDYIQKEPLNFLDFYIFKGSVFFRLNRYQEAKETLEYALENLDKSSFTQDENQYLRKYIYHILIAISSHTKHDLLKEKYKNLSKTIEFNQNKIKKTMLRAFPH